MRGGLHLRWLLRAIARGPLDPAFLRLMGRLMQALEHEGGHAYWQPVIGFRSAYAGSCSLQDRLFTQRVSFARSLSVSSIAIGFLMRRE